MGLNHHSMVICEDITKHWYESSHPDKRKSLSAESGGLYFFCAMKACFKKQKKK